MKVLAITGRMATGKSTILKQLKFLGASSFSSDEMVNYIYKRDYEFISTVMNLYPEVIEQGKINKNKLSNLAFNNKKILQKLEKLIHPILDRVYMIFAILLKMVIPIMTIFVKIL